MSNKRLYGDVEDDAEEVVPIEPPSKRSARRAQSTSEETQMLTRLIYNVLDQNLDRAFVDSLIGEIYFARADFGENVVREDFIREYLQAVKNGQVSLPFRAYVVREKGYPLTAAMRALGPGSDRVSTLLALWKGGPPTLNIQPHALLRGINRTSFSGSANYNAAVQETARIDSMQSRAAGSGKHPDDASHPATRLLLPLLLFLLKQDERNPVWALIVDRDLRDIGMYRQVRDAWINEQMLLETDDERRDGMELLLMAATLYHLPKDVSLQFDCPVPSVDGFLRKVSQATKCEIPTARYNEKPWLPPIYRPLRQDILQSAGYRDILDLMKNLEMARTSTSSEEKENRLLDLIKNEKFNVFDNSSQSSQPTNWPIVGVQLPGDFSMLLLAMNSASEHASRSFAQFGERPKDPVKLFYRLFPFAALALRYFFLMNHLFQVQEHEALFETFTGFCTSVIDTSKRPPLASYNRFTDIVDLYRVFAKNLADSFTGTLEDEEVDERPFLVNFMVREAIRQLFRPD